MLGSYLALVLLAEVLRLQLFLVLPEALLLGFILQYLVFEGAETLSHEVVILRLPYLERQLAIDETLATSALVAARPVIGALQFGLLSFSLLAPGVLLLLGSNGLATDHRWRLFVHLNEYAYII